MMCWGHLEDEMVFISYCFKGGIFVVRMRDQMAIGDRFSVTQSIIYLKATPTWCSNRCCIRQAQRPPDKGHRLCLTEIGETQLAKRHNRKVQLYHYAAVRMM